jgi:glycosyltransferase involved in cell wall biosynthesis
MSSLKSNIVVANFKYSKKIGFNWRVLWELKILMSRVDVMMSFLPASNIYCALASLLGKKPKHIACEMSIVNESESKIRRILANFANFSSSHVICNSITQAEYIRSLPGMKKKVSAIWNGCETVSEKRRNSRNQCLSLIIVGRVAYPKNGVRFLEAIRIFYERNGFAPNISWAGRDDSAKKDKLMKLQMIDFLDTFPAIKEKFQFLGEVKNIGSLYANTDALILPSLYEGVPNVICEAMLAECPVIASKISDNLEILGENEDRGFLCEPFSPMSICKAIERLATTSPEILNNMVKNAKEFARDHFSILTMKAQYDEVINNIKKD